MDNKLKHLIKILRNKGPLVLLDSQLPDHPSSQKSYLAAIPGVTIEVYGERIILHQPSGKTEEFEANPWEAFKDFRKAYPGWHFGWFGYDLKNHTEKLTSANPDIAGLPDLFFFRPEELYEIDPMTNKINVLSGKEFRYKENAIETEHATVTDLHPALLKDEYLAMIDEAKQLIREGEFYEINLSHPLSGDFSGDPLNLYVKMRDRGPVPFGAYFHLNDATLCCASPERFLRKKGLCLTSEPIKGTVRRGNNDEEDIFLIEEIRNSVKKQGRKSDDRGSCQK